MKKVISLLMIYAVIAFSIPIPSQAQFQTPSPNVLYSPAAINSTATCVTTACPTFILPAMCTATVRVTGTNSAIVVTVKVSNDAGANYSQVIPLIVGGAAGTGTVTTNQIAANGMYSITLASMNRVRFEIGTLTGTNVSIKLVATSACTSQAL